MSKKWWALPALLDWHAGIRPVKVEMDDQVLVELARG
jgi:hypothetical protein